MTTTVDPICLKCSHLDFPFKQREKKTTRWTCRAFPDGIPTAIVESERSHIDPIEGDNGFQYKEMTPANLKIRQKKIKAQYR